MRKAVFRRYAGKYSGVMKRGVVCCLTVPERGAKACYRCF
jgi:hypothetical protein